MKLLNVRWVLWVALTLAVLRVPAASAAATEAELILSANSARAGDTVLAGVHLRMKPSWHTYWRNPGGSGSATTIEWQLPPGVTAGAIQWPVPKVLPAEELTTYIYEREVVLIVPLKIAPNTPSGPLDLSAKISWLECAAQCVPGDGIVHARLNVGGESKPSPQASLITEWQKKLPLTNPALPASAWWEKAATNDSRALLLEWPAAGANAEADFYPYGSDKYDVQFTAESVPADPGRIRIRKLVKKLEGNWPDKIAGLLIQRLPGGNTQAYETDLPIAALGLTNQTVGNPLRSDTAIAAGNSKSLFYMLFYAFLGGLILNVMPCVLPVIALKILGFVNQGGNHPGRVRELGLIYGAGVLISFLVLAGLVIGVKLAGHRAGWGMQFGNPEFIVVMTVLVTLVALNLFGVFEVNLSGKVMGAAGNLSSRDGAAGAFFNGVLATVLATPCTAPFLGVALGFAFGQSYAIIILIFLTVGLGLAAPYVVLSWNPAMLKLLPKPGAWMEKFKIAMGFPMLATAVWLFDLTTVHYGRRVLWLALFLVMVALAAWIFGEFVQRGRRHKLLAGVIALMVLGVGYLYAVEGQLNWRLPMADAANVTTRQHDGIDWQPWSARAVADATAAGHPVLVDFTADWCQVCQVNRKTSIDIKRVQEKIRQINAVALQGDYTKLPESITAELNRYGRAGVPLVLVYPGKAGAAPQILPDGYLTPGIVLGALDQAAN